jgi:lysophospholipase L1-like esterase
MIRWISCIFLFQFSIGVIGQNVSDIDSVLIKTFPNTNFNADTISNVRHLSTFFDKLMKIEAGENCIVNISHIGDSHIQADFLTREIRVKLQHKFGNAGRGLIFPLKLTHTNEPMDFRSSSNFDWQFARVIGSSKFPQPGLAGVSIKSENDSAKLDIETYNHDSLNYAFNQVSVIQNNDSAQFHFYLSDSTVINNQLPTSEISVNDYASITYNFKELTNHFSLSVEKKSEKQNNFTLNGFILQNKLPGILYHSIGINGAHFVNFNKSELFFEQLPLLNSDLIIISLGTNEGLNSHISESEIITMATNMIDKIKAVNQQSSILLITAFDNLFRNKRSNPYLKIVNNALLKSASLTNVACLDVYDITGGFGSATEWKRNGFLRADGIHYTKEAYALQGKIIYKAIIDSYLKYVSTRHR